MRKWKLIYEMHDEFSTAVSGHYFSLRCFPKEMVSQKIKSFSCSIHPGSVSSRGRDSFSNFLLTGCCMQPHDQFYVKVESLVAKKNIAEPEIKELHCLGMFRQPTRLTSMGDSLNAFYDTLMPGNGEDSWTRARWLMECLSRSFSYQSGSTNVNTTAEEAFFQGCGVCQDYAHVLLSLCRKEQMTARYVAGAVPGEGQTHAWIEVLKDGKWKGFDPTNNRETDDSYISFAVGRDAADCGLNRGIFLGNAGQRQFVNVKMEEESFDRDNCICINAGSGKTGNP